MDKCCVFVIDWALFTLNCSVLPQCVWHTQPTLAIHVQQFFFLNILWTVILSINILHHGFIYTVI